MNDKETQSNNENGLTTTQRNDTHPQTHRNQFVQFCDQFWAARKTTTALMLLLYKECLVLIQRLRKTCCDRCFIVTVCRASNARRFVMYECCVHNTVQSVTLYGTQRIRLCNWNDAEWTRNEMQANENGANERNKDRTSEKEPIARSVLSSEYDGTWKIRVIYLCVRACMPMVVYLHEAHSTEHILPFDILSLVNVNRNFDEYGRACYVCISLNKILLNVLCLLVRSNVVCVLLCECVFLLMNFILSFSIHHPLTWVIKHLQTHCIWFSLINFHYSFFFSVCVFVCV